MDDAEDAERARRADAELKETEDLLAGFDRPGRTPRVPPVQRDFVEYHLGSKGTAPRVRAPQLAPESDRELREVSTAIVRRRKRALPRWAPWAGLAFGMALTGVLAMKVLSSPSEGSRSVTVSSPSAAMTISSGMAAFEPTSGPERDIPPPPPLPTATVTTPTDSVTVTPAVRAASTADPSSDRPPPPRTQAPAPAAPPPTAATAATPSVTPTASAPARPPASSNPEIDLIRHM